MPDKEEGGSSSPLDESTSNQDGCGVEEPQLSDIDAEKVMFMCAREGITDVFKDVEKIRLITSQEPPYDIDKVTEICDKINIGAADKSLQIIMSGLAEKMESIENAKINDLVLATKLLKHSSGMRAGAEFINSHINGINRLVKNLVGNILHCGTCGCSHPKEEWCKVESFSVMKCAACGNSSLIPNDVEVHTDKLQCGQCPSKGKWEFAAATLEDVKSEWPAYGEGKMNEAMQKEKQPNPDKEKEPDA